MKWGISPSSEMPHFFVYFSTRTIMVCLLSAELKDLVEQGVEYFNTVEISGKRNNLTTEDFRNETV